MTGPFLTSLERAWALDGVLCLEHFNGNAAILAELRYKYVLSVGVGCNLAMAALNV